VDPVLRFLSKLVEDYADEWCWRAALYWRWIPKESRKALMARIGREVLEDFPVPASVAGWYYGRRQIAMYLRGDGVSAETARIVEQSYLALLESMSTLLETQPFLLGSHPTLVDIALFGPMFRHYFEDPTPRRVMQERAPLVFDWVERVWNARGSEYPSSIEYSSFSHPGWSYFLRDIVQSYWPYLVRSARAWQSGKRRVDHQAHGVTYRGLRVTHYRVYCLEVLQRELAALDPTSRAEVERILRPYGALEPIPGLSSGLMKEHELPLPRSRHQASRIKTLLLGLTGTPWDMPVKPRDE
jgi:glutathione S-transferase